MDNQPTIQDSKKAMQIEILQTFARLQRIDRNALTNLKKLADMAEKQPAKYYMALKFL
jgi:hypothetical protein